MFPILFESNGFILASWHVLFVCGAFVAWYSLQWLRESLVPEIKPSEIDKLFVLLYLGGYLGARLLSIAIEDRPQNFSEFLHEISRFGAMTLYGGVLIVALLLMIWARRRKISLQRVAALFIAPGLLAIGLGRIGCFLNGDDFGKAIRDQLHPGFMHVRFPALGDGLYRYPVQVWEAALCIVTGMVLFCWARKRPSLVIADVGIGLYTIGRFVIEFWRGDERGFFLGTSLSTSQGISLVLLIAWVVYRFWLGRRQKLAFKI